MLNRFSLFMMICVFSGALVLVAAHDIRKRLQPPTAQELEYSQELITNLRSENILPAEKAFVEEARKPARKPGSYLPQRDWERLKKAVQGFFASPEPEEVK